MTESIVRVLSGFGLTAATVTVTTLLMLGMSGGVQAPHTWLSFLNRASQSAPLIGWIYLWALALVLAFGLPAFLILQARRWSSFVAYALAGVVSANIALAVIFAAWRLPTFGWYEFATWAAVCGAVGGATFRAIAGPRRRFVGRGDDPTAG